MLVLGLLVWCGQAIAFQRLAQAELVALDPLARIVAASLCTSHGGEAGPVAQTHDCCLSCVGVASGGIPGSAPSAVSPAPTWGLFVTGIHAPPPTPRYLRRPAREPPLA
jgi:hypothetical protein